MAMSKPQRPVAERLRLSRRRFLQAGAIGAAALPFLPLAKSAAEPPPPTLESLIRDLQYLTPESDFGNVERGKPVPSSLPASKLKAVGLARETWKLEVVADPTAPAKIRHPLTKQGGTALDWSGLMRLSEQHAVRFLKIMTCNNIGAPLGMGLWEGVPLSTVIWLARPAANLRRVSYLGYHNDDAKQIFQSSLPIGRVLETAPGEYPVILCYKMNGEYLTAHRGGPVRMLVPDAYGFKSVKWIQRIVLSNDPFGNDTYAKENNDVDSQMKTFARFVSVPTNPKAGQPIPIVGSAQVGVSGLSKVQYWLAPREKSPAEDDPYFAYGNWKDARILPPPTGRAWGGPFKEGRLPKDILSFDSAGRPKTWPLRYALAQWAAVLPGVPAGKYDLRCRTIDENGFAQPLPRPFEKSGHNAIETFELEVASA
jgi:DMSO/TMAO reductase YedYZ molybdopterin-dependent catalytic subunit